MSNFWFEFFTLRLACFCRQGPERWNNYKCRASVARLFKAEPLKSFLTAIKTCQPQSVKPKNTKLNGLNFRDIAEGFWFKGALPEWRQTDHVSGCRNSAPVIKIPPQYPWGNFQTCLILWFALQYEHDTQTLSRLDSIRKYSRRDCFDFSACDRLLFNNRHYSFGRLYFPCRFFAFKKDTRVLLAGSAKRTYGS